MMFWLKNSGPMIGTLPSNGIAIVCIVPGALNPFELGAITAS